MPTASTLRSRSVRKPPPARGVVLVAALGIGLAACGHQTGAGRVVHDYQVTSAVHPFFARYGGHCAGVYYDSTSPWVFRARGDQLFSQGTTDGVDAGLWVTDATATGTRLVVSSTQYREGADTPFIRELLPTDRGVFFAMDPPCVFPAPLVPTPRPAPLWWTSGQSGATSLLLGHQVQDLVRAGDRLFFKATGADPRTGLWSLNLDAKQASEVWHFDEVGDTVALTSGGVVFFGTRSGEERRIWFSDGTEDGSHGLEEWCGQTLSGLVSVGQKAYFVCGRDLTMTDGTPNGTRPVAGAPSMPTDVFSHLVDFNGRLAFFFRPVAADAPVDLWITDGSAAGTLRLASFSLPLSESDGSHGLVVGNTLYFVVHDTLWKTDGTAANTTALAALPAPAGFDDWYYASRHARFMATLGESLFVVMGDAELWRVDGANATLVPLDPSVSNIQAIAATPSRVYYAASVTGQPTDALRLVSLRAWSLADE